MYFLLHPQFILCNGEIELSGSLLKGVFSKFNMGLTLVTF